MLSIRKSKIFKFDLNITLLSAVNAGNSSTITNINNNQSVNTTNNKEESNNNNTTNN